jgi:hypothetical protein
MIAARLEQDHGLSSHLIRGSRTLANPDLSADYAIFDTSAPPTHETELLSAVLNSPSLKWNLISRVPITLGSSRRGELLVYHRKSRALPSAEPDSAQLGPQERYRTLTCNEP